MRSLILRKILSPSSKSNWRLVALIEMERRYSENKDSRELAFAGQEFLFRFSDDRCNIRAHNPNESCLVWSE